MQAMGDNVVGKIIDEQLSRLSDWFSSWWPDLVLIEWILVFVAFTLLIGFIVRFLPFKWAQVALGWIWSMGAAVLAGGLLMRRMLSKSKRRS